MQGPRSITYRMKRFLKAIWEFVSFLFVPQQGRHITQQAQSYAPDLQDEP